MLTDKAASAMNVKNVVFKLGFPSFKGSSVSNHGGYFKMQIRTSLNLVETKKLGDKQVETIVVTQQIDRIVRWLKPDCQRLSTRQDFFANAAARWAISFVQIRSG